MTQEYRLVFSGEVAEGQHAAVVKKRLTTVLKLDDKRMDVLFSGKSVVVKKATDEKTAARYQQVFQKAGAKLRVLPVSETDGDASASEAASQIEASDPAKTQAEPQTSEQEQTSAANDGGIKVLPPGADMLRADERQVIAAPEIDTDHLSVQGSVFVTDDTEEPVDVPQVDHITLAELGAILGNDSDPPLVAEIDADFDLAEVGALLRDSEAEESEEIAVPDPDFDIADVGADLNDSDKAPPPAAPDVSHITLEDDDTKTN